MRERNGEGVGLTKATQNLEDIQKEKRTLHIIIFSFICCTCLCNVYVPFQ